MEIQYDLTSFDEMISLLPIDTMEVVKINACIFNFL